MRGRIPKIRACKIKEVIKQGICRIVENSENCDLKVHSRGLCNMHYGHFDLIDMLDQFAIESLRVRKLINNEKKLKRHERKIRPIKVCKIKKVIKQGICRIVENNENCDLKVDSRGLCAMHYGYLFRSGEIEQYGAKLLRGPESKSFHLNKKLRKGLCRIIENGKECQRKFTARGLCAKHYGRFLKEGRLEQFTPNRLVN